MLEKCMMFFHLRLSTRQTRENPFLLNSTGATSIAIVLEMFRQDKVTVVSRKASTDWLKQPLNIMANDG